MYQLVIHLYLLAIRIYALFNDKVRKMWHGEQATWHILAQKLDPKARYIWFHAASLGEFEQGRPLMERIRRQYPHYRILLTFFSPSGFEVRKDYQGADIICYLPLDTKHNAKRFLDAVNPCMAFFIKYEFWYNYLHILKDRGIPTYSVSSIFRKEQVFFQWYGRKYADVLTCFTKLFVQNEESRRLLSTIGVESVEVVGDTRFDRVLQIQQAGKILPIVEAFIADSAKHTFIAGSSWEPDEELFLPYFQQNQDWKLIIAPHVISPAHIASITRLLAGKKIAFYADTTPEQAAQADVLFINCFGLLSSIYRYADVSYIGGGFGTGIHNTLEAAVWGKPVLFGPNHQRFAEAQGLLRSKGGIEVRHTDDFTALMQEFSDHPERIAESGRQAAAYVQSLAGATEKVLGSILLD